MVNHKQHKIFIGLSSILLLIFGLFLGLQLAAKGSTLNLEIIMKFAEIVLMFIALIYSVIFHEIAHGYIALRLGDDTAKNAGRLTLNPIPHLDMVGSIILPALLILSKGTGEDVCSLFITGPSPSTGGGVS